MNIGCANRVMVYCSMYLDSRGGREGAATYTRAHSTGALTRTDIQAQHAPILLSLCFMVFPVQVSCSPPQPVTTLHAHARTHTHTYTLLVCVRGTILEAQEGATICTFPLRPSGSVNPTISALRLLGEANC